MDDEMEAAASDAADDAVAEAVAADALHTFAGKGKAISQEGAAGRANGVARPLPFTGAWLASCRPS